MRNDGEKVREYNIPKKLKFEAKILGLNYNTFFFFVTFTAIALVTGSSKKLIGFIIAILLTSVMYIVLFFIQTKLGTKELWKKINDYNNPIHYLQIKKSFQRSLTFKKRSNNEI
mgnify:CR=1 FL=1